MTHPDPKLDSPVFARALGVEPRIAMRGSGWTTVLGIAGACLIGLVAFLGLQGHRHARAAAPAARAAVVPPSAAPVMAATAPPPSIVSQPPIGAVTPASPVAAPRLAPDTGAQRSPVLIVDFSGGRESAPAQAAPGSAAGAAAAGGARAAGSDKLSPDELFSERMGESKVDTARSERLADPQNTAPQGTVIPAVLETAINSDLPGFVRAVVSRDVRGFDGSRVLIPRGSKLIGQYRSGAAAGQSRAFVVWSRVLTPEGVSIDVSSPGADRLGRGGLEGETDTHFFRRFGASILLSVLNGAIDVAAARQSSGTAVIIESPAQASRLAEVALQKEIDIPPTIKVPPGQPIRVFVARDLDFSATQTAGAK